MHIRAFTPAEYEALAALHTVVDPDDPRSAGDLLELDTTRALRYTAFRLVAEEAGRLVGHAWFGQDANQFHPRKWVMQLEVHPERQGQGIGRALFERILETARAHDLLALKTETREDRSRAVRFLSDRGFEETLRFWDSWLEVGAFDFRPYAALEAQLEAEGITVRSLRELEADPDRDRKLYGLIITIARDVPSDEPFEPLGFDEFLEQRLNRPDQIPDAYLVAVHGDRYIGLSNLKRRTDENLAVGLTGVLREYRGKEVGLAMKVKNIAWAHRQGIPHLITGNESTNQPILRINERLGFVKRPAWIAYALKLREG